MTQYTFFPLSVQFAPIVRWIAMLFAVVEIISLQFLHRAETVTEAKPLSGIVQSHTVSAPLSTAWAYGLHPAPSAVTGTSSTASKNTANRFCTILFIICLLWLALGQVATQLSSVPIAIFKNSACQHGDSIHSVPPSAVVKVLCL